MEAKQRELQAAVNDMMSKVWRFEYSLAFIDRSLTVVSHQRCIQRVALFSHRLKWRSCALSREICI